MNMELFGALWATDVMRDGYSVSQEFADFWGGVAFFVFVVWLGYQFVEMFSSWRSRTPAPAEQAKPRLTPQADQRASEPNDVPLDWAKAVRNAIGYVTPATAQPCASTGNLEWRAQHLSGFIHSVHPEPFGLSPRLVQFDGEVYWLEDVVSLEQARLEIVVRAHGVQRYRHRANPSPELLDELRHVMRSPEGFHEAGRKVMTALERDVEILEGLLSSNSLCSNPSDARALVDAEIGSTRGLKADSVRRSKNTDIGPLQRAEYAQAAALCDDLLESLETLLQRL